MITQIDLTKKIRVFLLQIIGSLTVQQLNEIPAGFNNNIIWNMGHLISIQQNICYEKSNLAYTVAEKYVTSFNRGTKPDRFIDQIEITEIKEILISSIDKFSDDYEKEIFNKYNPWTTRYGKELKNINDVIAILPFHDGLHMGAITAIKKFLRSDIDHNQ